MKTRGSTALLALFFAGLVGLWLADRAHLPTRADLDRAKGRILVGLIDVRPDDLRKIEIDGGDRPLVFERREGNLWQMTVPLDVAADPSKVETLAFNLKELARKPEAATIAGEGDDYGLARPARTVRLWGRPTDAPLAVLEVGKTSLARRYVRVAGSEGIEVVDAEGLELVDLPAARWRDRELFRVPSFEVDRLSLTGPGRDLKLERKPDGWRITGPFRALAQEAKVDGLVADLGALRVTDDARFALDDARDADLDRFGLKVPVLTVAVDAGRVDHRRAQQVLHVGKPVEGQPGLVYARRGDQDDVVMIEGRSLAGLGANPNAFRSPKVADIHLNRVARFQVDADGKSFEVARQGNDWIITKPEFARADRQAVQAFLRSLDGLQTEIHLDPRSRPDFGLDKPQIRLQVWEAGNGRAGPTAAPPEPDFALDIGRRDATTKTVFARTDGDPTAFGLPEAVLESFPRSVLGLRDHLVIALRVERIERLALSGSGRKVALNAPVLALDPFKTGPIGWWMVEPVVAPADPEAMGRLLKLLGGLRADALVADSADAPALARFGLKDPPLTLTWSAFAPDTPDPAAKAGRKGGARFKLEEYSLQVGAQVPGKPATRYAKLDDRPLIFTLPAEAVATVGAEFRDHRALTFDPGQVRRVRLDWRERSLTFAIPAGSNNGAWALEGPVDAPGFRPEGIPALIRNASTLTTNRFLQYEGPIPPSTGLEPAVLTIRFGMDGVAPPRTLRVGHPSSRGEVFASTADGPAGPIFLTNNAPFLPWIRPPRQAGDLPADVFTPDPAP